MTMHPPLQLVVSSLLIATVLGCAGRDGPSAEGVKYVLAEEPEDPMHVDDLRSLLTSGSDPGEVAVIGRVGGGQVSTWDPSQAVFVLRDMSLVLKTHDHGGDHDDCKFCQAEKARQLESMAQVQIVDEGGQVVPADARSLLGLKENHIVVAEGKGEVDEVGNLVFSARKIHVRR